MKEVKFVGGVKFDDVMNFYGVKNGRYEGGGIYRFKIGCRGFIDEIKKVSGDDVVEVREVDDILKGIEEGKIDVSLMCWGMEKVKEFVFSEFVDWYEDDIGLVYVESWDEEDCFEFVRVL